MESAEVSRCLSDRPEGALPPNRDVLGSSSQNRERLPAFYEANSLLCETKFDEGINKAEPDKQLEHHIIRCRCEKTSGDHFLHRWTVWLHQRVLHQSNEVGNGPSVWP